MSSSKHFIISYTERNGYGCDYVTWIQYYLCRGRSLYHQAELISDFFRVFSKHLIERRFQDRKGETFHFAKWIVNTRNTQFA